MLQRSGWGRRAVTVAVLLGSLATAESGWVVKINGKAVPTDEFQNYVHFLRDTQGKEAVQSILKDPDDTALLFQNFLDTKILLLAASKAGYGAEHPLVKKAQGEQNGEMMLTYFLNRQLNKYGSFQPGEEDLKATFRKVSQGQTNRTFESLQENEKAQVFQLASLEKRQAAQKRLQNDLEAQYGVKRKPQALVAAKIGAETIKTSDVSDSLTRELAAQGIQAKALFDANRAQYNELESRALDNLILRKLLNEEMKKAGFLSSEAGRYASAAYADEFVKQAYLQEELLSKISVSDAEMNEEYRKNERAFQGQPADRVWEYLKSAIRQRKSQKIYQQFLIERREEVQVQRNREELKKIQ